MTPPGWTTVTLRDVASDISYGFTASASDVANGPKMLRITDIQDNRVDWNSVPRCECDATDKYLLHPGDIVIARTGATTGKSFLLGDVPEASVFASYLIRVQPSAVVVPAYLASYMQSPSYWAQITTVSKGTAQPGANASILGGLELPLAPVEEQRRIVAKLEALQSRSRRAREALDAVPPLLEKLRQSILAAAFRGDLTKDWRAQNPNPERASALLARIRTERRKKWEESELAKLKAKGKLPTDDRWKAKYEEPEPIDTTELPELPEGWCWAAFDELAFDSLYGPRFGAEQYTPTGFPTLRTTDLTDEGEIAWSKPPCVRISEDDYACVGLRPNDFVVTRTGATIGKCALYRDRDGAAVPSAYLIRFGLISDSVNPEYTLQATLSPERQAALRGAATATAQPNINARAIGRLAIPVAPAPSTATKRSHE